MLIATLLWSVESSGEWGVESCARMGVYGMIDYSTSTRMLRSGEYHVLLSKYDQTQISEVWEGSSGYCPRLNFSAPWPLKPQGI
jgi:hypothetical protein